MDGTAELSDVELESAKSSLIFEIIEEEKTPANASVESMLSYFRGVAHDYNRWVKREFSAVLLRGQTSVPLVICEGNQRISQKPCSPGLLLSS